MESDLIMISLPVDSAQLADLWHQVRSVAEERSKDFGDVALQYHLAEPGDVTVSVYNAEGALVQSLSQYHDTSGTYFWTWNGRGRNGKLMPAGIYLYELRYGDERVSAKMLMLK